MEGGVECVPTGFTEQIIMLQNGNKLQYIKSFAGTGTKLSAGGRLIVNKRPFCESDPKNDVRIQNKRT